MICLSLRLNLAVRCFLLSVFTILSAAAHATSQTPKTWYVRPQAAAGAYGLEDGSSYANAFNGLTAAGRDGKAGLVWGTGGIEAGDTLYICGNHWLQISQPADSFFHGRIAIPVQGQSAQSPITIRSDAPAEAGTVWGYGRNTTLSDAWSGPDANGVWRLGRDLGEFIAQDVAVAGKGTVYLTELGTTTWAGSPGAFCRSGGATYVKTTDGKSPAGRLYTGDIAYRFALLRNQFITFKNCNFPGFLMDIDRDENGERITSLPRSTHITFDGCTFRYGMQNFFQLYDGDDDWQFLNCTMEYAPCAIYTYGLMGGVGASNMTVRGCTFRHLGVLMFPHQDAHGVGVQRGRGHLIEHNTFEDTGSAIEFWTSVGNPMRDMTVRYNFIKNSKIKAITEGNGITISGENGNSLGERTGFKIYGNIVMDAEGDGIRSNNPDPVTVTNNVAYNCATGIRMEVNGNAVQATVKNNIIANPRELFISCHGMGNILNWDNNLYYASSGSSSALWAPFVSLSNWSQEMGTDVHSRAVNPGFVSTTPTKATDFKLVAGSPAIDAGANLGLAMDYAGGAVPQGLAPDIGAFEMGATPTPTPRPTATPTPTPTPTPRPTATPTPTPRPTATPTPTPTPTPRPTATPTPTPTPRPTATPTPTPTPRPTATPTPTPRPTATPTPTPRPTATPTPIPSPTPSPDSPIFNLSHETGRLEGYSSLVNPSGLAVRTVAAQAGSNYGLEVIPSNDGDREEVMNLLPPSNGNIHWRLYCNADALVLPLSQYLTISRLDAAGGTIVSVNLINLGGQYYLNVDANQDGGWFDDCILALGKGAHCVELAVRKASAPGVADGRYDVYVDNVFRKTFSAVPNSTLFGTIKALSLGAMSVPAGTSGKIYLDEFTASSNTALIGQASYVKVYAPKSAASDWRMYP